MTTDKERAEFEAWGLTVWDDFNPITERNLKDGGYHNIRVDTAWNAWQAARANSGYDESFDICMDLNYKLYSLLKRCADYIEKSDLRDIDFGLGFEKYADEISLAVKAMTFTPPQIEGN